MTDPRCAVPGCGRPCPYTDWTTCEEHSGVSQADMTEVAKLAEYVRRVRAGEPRFMAYAEVGTIRSIDGDQARVAWVSPGGCTNVFHADIRRAVER